MTESSHNLKIVDGAELTTTTSSAYTVGTAAGLNQATNCGGSALGYTWPYYTQTYVAPPNYDVQIRFVENGVLVSFKGKEYIFKDINAAANHITKLQGSTK